MKGYALVRKRDLSVVFPLKSEQMHAIQIVENGGGDEHLKSIVGNVLERAREWELWLGCDCTQDGERRPVVVPCRSQRGNGYWRALGAPQIEHEEDCVFHRSRRRRAYDQLRNRKARQPPTSRFVAVLRKEAEEHRLAERVDRADGDRQGGERARPALSRWLLQLLVKAKLDRADTGDGFECPEQWIEQIKKATKEYEVAPGQPLSQWWFSDPKNWQSKQVHKRLEKAADDWPGGHRPQAFLSWVVWEAAAGAVGEKGRGTHVEVAKRVRLPTVDGNAVRGPYLFIGVVGLGKASNECKCIEAYAQPIVARKWPVPVDSHYERQAFGTLRKTMKVLEGEFQGAACRLEKPVFDVETPDGPCLPDFMMKVERGGETVRFVIEVMGFERAAYLKGKEVTHPRMERLGTLCTMQASEFGRSRDGVRNEGMEVTRRIRETLTNRWGR